MIRFKLGKNHPNWDKVKPFTLEQIESKLVQNQAITDFRYAKLIDELMDLIDALENLVEAQVKEWAVAMHEPNIEPD